MPNVDFLAVNFRGRAQRMQPGDLARLADQRGYELAMLEAILDVESGGVGFDDLGRPKELPELHVFYRQLGPGPKRDAAVRAGLAYLNQGERPYPVGSEANYARLKQMMSFDMDAALMSTSFGIGQVMGFNFKACGFSDVRAMVMAAMDSELAQFEMVLAYLEYAGLGPAIKARNFDAIARGYNGPKAVVTYGGRLRAAYAQHSSPAPARQPIRPTAAPALKPAPVPSALRQAPVTADSLNDAQYLKIRAGLAA